MTGSLDYLVQAFKIDKYFVANLNKMKLDPSVTLFNVAITL